MKIQIGFIDFIKNEDDIYLLPTLAIGYYKSIHGMGIGIGIKFIKLIFAIRLLSIKKEYLK